MKKAILITAILGMSFGLSSFIKPNRVSAGKEIKNGLEYYECLYVYKSANQTYYISNVIFVEGKDGFDYSENLDVQKERFKKILRNKYDVDWTAPVQDYRDGNEDRVTDVRNSKIKYAGDHWDSIDL